jgi:hypothetical protein
MPQKPGLKRKLLTPDAAAIRRPASPAQPDAVGSAHLTGTPAQLVRENLSLPRTASGATGGGARSFTARRAVG